MSNAHRTRGVRRDALTRFDARRSASKCPHWYLAIICILLNARQRVDTVGVNAYFNISLIWRVDARRRARCERGLMLKSLAPLGL